MNPCSTESPASAGIPTASTGSLARVATSSTIGTSSTTPTSKNSGMPIRAATPAIAHGRVRGPTRDVTASTTLFAPAGVREQAADPSRRARRARGRGARVGPAAEKPGDAEQGGEDMTAASRWAPGRSRTLTSAAGGWCSPPSAHGVLLPRPGRSGPARLLGSRSAASAAVGDRVRVTLRPDPYTGLVRAQRLERLELAAQQRGRHEVSLPMRDAVGEDGLVGEEVHEPDRRMPVAQQIAVGASECRAGDDRALAGGLPGADPVGDPAAATATGRRRSAGDPPPSLPGSPRDGGRRPPGRPNRCGPRARVPPRSSRPPTPPSRRGTAAEADRCSVRHTASLAHAGPPRRAVRRTLAMSSNMCSNLAMRWSGQQVFDDGIGSGLALPGLRGLLRTVRVPEFAGTTFHEVEAKSALNRVPATSPVPFRWTVNPYRGCGHACVYCLAGPTPRAACRRSHPADCGAAGRRRRGRHRTRRRRPPLRAHHRAGALVHHEARPSAQPGRRHRHPRERRAPLPLHPRLAARRPRVVPVRASPPVASRRRSAGAGHAPRTARAHPVLPAGVPPWAGPRGRRGSGRLRRADRRHLPLGTARVGGAGAGASFPRGLGPPARPAWSASVPPVAVGISSAALPVSLLVSCCWRRCLGGPLCRGPGLPPARPPAVAASGRGGLAPVRAAAPRRDPDDDWCAGLLGGLADAGRASCGLLSPSVAGVAAEFRATGVAAGAGADATAGAPGALGRSGPLVCCTSRCPSISGGDRRAATVRVRAHRGVGSRAGRGVGAGGPAPSAHRRQPGDAPVPGGRGSGGERGP